MAIDWHLCERDFFNDLPLEKEDFLLLAKKRSFPKKSYLFREGEPSTTCFYLLKGYVKIIRSSPSGREPIYFLRRTGEFFGLAEVLDSEERRASAQAITQCTVFEIGRKDFDKLMSHHPAMAKKIIGVLGRRIRYLGELIESLMFNDVATRLLRILFHLSCHQLNDQDYEKNCVTVPLKLSQEQLADFTGACQQTISETLKKLREEGLIEIENKQIRLIQPLDLLERITG